MSALDPRVDEKSKNLDITKFLAPMDLLGLYSPKNNVFYHFMGTGSLRSSLRDPPQHPKTQILTLYPQLHNTNTFSPIF